MQYFITGVDTDIGKTYVTKGLALSFAKQGKTVGVFKPLQSSAIKTPTGYLAPDLEAIKELSFDISTKCSYIFGGDVSPALAARLANVKIDIEKIKYDFEIFSKENEIVLVEGAGGILAPATDDCLCADLIKKLNIPIISSMGTGNKLNPFAFQISDIFKTSVCPLARTMRYELKKRGYNSKTLKNLKVLFSTENPASSIRPPASISFVPSVAGLMITSEVIKDLCNK